jgi:hypothetical protein
MSTFARTACIARNNSRPHIVIDRDAVVLKESRVVAGTTWGATSGASSRVGSGTLRLKNGAESVGKEGGRERKGDEEVWWIKDRVARCDCGEGLGKIGKKEEKCNCIEMVEMRKKAGPEKSRKGIC